MGVETKPELRIDQEKINQWFEADTSLPNNVVAIQEPYHGEEVICYLVKGQTQDLLIDTGMGIGSVRCFANRFRNPFKKITVVNTHWHFDHIGGNRDFEPQEVLVPAISNEAELISQGWSHKELQRYDFENGFGENIPAGFDPRLFDIPKVSNISSLITDGWTIDLGNREITAIHTPGHTPGSICFFDKTYGALFSSDLLYEGPLYAFEKESNPKDYLRSLEKLRDRLRDNITIIHPGHNFTTNKNEPDLLYEAIWLFERVARREPPESLSKDFPGVVEYHHPKTNPKTDKEGRRRLKVLVREDR